MYNRNQNKSSTLVVQLKSLHMVEQKHVEIFKQVVKVSNAWRDNNPDVIPDLSRAELNEIELSSTNLKNATFYSSADSHDAVLYNQ